MKTIVSNLHELLSTCLYAVSVVDLLRCLLQERHFGVERDNDVLFLLKLSSKFLLEVRLGLLLKARLHARVLLRSLKNSHLLPELANPSERTVLRLLHHLLHLPVLGLEVAVGAREVGVPALVLVVPSAHLAQHREQVLLADRAKLGRARVIPAGLGTSARLHVRE